MKKSCTDNKGFTLVELIIGVAILAIVTAAIAGFMVTGTKNYTNQNTEVTIQEEAQLAVNQIADILIDTARSVSYVENGNDRVLVVYNGEEQEDGSIIERYSGEKNYYFKFDSELKEVSYVEFAVEFEQPSKDSNSIECLLAEDVTDFTADMSMLESKRVVGLSITIERRNKKYTANTNITIRNKILYNVIDPEVIPPGVSFKIQMPKKVYVLEPNDTFSLPEPTVIGKNIKKSSGNPSFTWATTSDLVAVSPDGNIVVHDLKQGTAKLKVTGEYTADSKKYKSDYEIDVVIKRANKVNISASGNKTAGEIDAGETIVVTANVSGDKLGATCDKCKAATEHDYEILNWSFDSSIFTQTASTADSITLKAKENLPLDSETKIKVYSYHSMHNGSNNSGAGYMGGRTGADGSDHVYGELTLRTAKEKSPYEYAGFLTYGYTDSGNGYWNAGVNCVIAVRINDSGTPDHSTDKIILMDSVGANTRLDPDTFGLDWTKEHYVWVQMFEKRADYDQATFKADYLANSSKGYYAGSNYNAIRSLNGKIEIPNISTSFNGVTYKAQECQLDDVLANTNNAEANRFDLLTINGMYDTASNKYIGMTVYKKDGSGWKKLSSNIDRSNGLKLTQNQAYYEPGITGQYGGLSLAEIIGTTPRTKMSTSGDYKTSVGEYKIVPSIVYRCMDLGYSKYLRDLIFYMNYAPDYTTVREKECTESNLYFKILDPSTNWNLYGLKIFVNQNNKLTMKVGEIYFPSPYESDFNKYFDIANGKTEYNVKSGFHFKSDWEQLIVNFTKMECKKIGADYYLTLYYDATNTYWGNTEKLINAGTFRWNSSTNQWDRSSKGKYDDGGEPNVGASVKNAKAAVKIINWDYNAYTIDVNIPLPGAEDFYPEFKALTTGQTAHIYNKVLDYEIYYNDYYQEHGTHQFAEITCELNADGSYYLKIYYYDNYDRTHKTLGGDYRANTTDNKWIPKP